MKRVVARGERESPLKKERVEEGKEGKGRPHLHVQGVNKKEKKLRSRGALIHDR